jgi:hypothetical protein
MHVKKEKSLYPIHLIKSFKRRDINYNCTHVQSVCRVKTACFTVYIRVCIKKKGKRKRRKRSYISLFYSTKEENS